MKKYAKSYRRSRTAVNLLFGWAKRKQRLALLCALWGSAIEQIRDLNSC
jgi:hypothetical protein